MALNVEHGLHKRRLGQNIGLALTLLAFVAVIFGLTLAKVGEGGQEQGFDHVVRPEMMPEGQQ